jgi:predicted O-linked N-acetylglucosamine transferase (SPINDLY family)
VSIAEEALLLMKRGDTRGAIALIESSDPSIRNTQSVFRLHAAALAQLGDIERATERIERALARPPVEPAARALAARIYEDATRYTEAAEQYRIVIETGASQITFWRGLWRVASKASDISVRTQSLALTKSMNFDASVDVGVAWAVSHAMLEAQPLTDAIVDAVLSIADRTLERHPIDASAQWLLVKRYVDCRPCEAMTRIANLNNVLSETVTSDEVNAKLALPQLYANDVAVDVWRARYEASIRAMLTVSQLQPDAIHATAFQLAYHGRDDLSLQTLRGDWLHRAVQSFITPDQRRNDAEAVTPSDRKTARLPRIGFVSKHLRDCTVGHYFKRFVTDLNQPHAKHFEVFVYACGKRDALTDEIESAVDKLDFFPLAGDDDHRVEVLQHISNRVIADRLDILIYPEIGMEPLIEKLAALRLAPLQCALWGHPVTTGLPTIDVFFSSAAMEPLDGQAHYRERLHLLPGLGTNYPVPPPPARVARRDLNLPDDTPLIVCAQSSYKWTAQFVTTVAKILDRCPQAKLVLFRNRDSVAAYAFDRYLNDALGHAAIDVESRVIALPETDRSKFLATLSHCDLSLDTFGFSGGNTSLDALSVGVPVLTLPGRFMRGRQTMAMLELIEARELIATDSDDYMTKAVRIASDKNARQSLHHLIQTNSHRLFNDALPIAALRRFLLSADNRR